MAGHEIPVAMPTYRYQPVLGESNGDLARTENLPGRHGCSPGPINRHRHQLRSCLGRYATRTAAKAWRTRGGLCAPHGAASARDVPVSARLPARGGGIRGLAGIARLRRTSKPHFPPSRRLRIGKSCAQKPRRTLQGSPARLCNQYHAAASIFAAISPPQNHSSAAS
jgi:hypothetical protein